MRTTSGPMGSGHGKPYRAAFHYLEEATATLFAQDPRVQSVGIGRFPGGFGYRVTRNERFIIAQGRREELSQIDGIPVSYVSVSNSVQPLMRVPLQGSKGRGGNLTLEQERHRPIVCGLQIQNLDCDHRVGNIQSGFIKIGTLGCFVEVDGIVCLLSNNHVLAGGNDGQPGDKIVQPEIDGPPENNWIAELKEYVPLQYSPYSASLAAGNIVLNEVDAGIATINKDVPYQQGYLSHHQPRPINGVGTAQIGESVFKIGRTTGLTHGVVTANAVTVAPQYDGGPCWFRRSLEIESLDNNPFSDSGDSGAAVVNGNGEVVGILYAGNGSQTFACPIELMLSSLNCRLI